MKTMTLAVGLLCAIHLDAPGQPVFPVQPQSQSVKPGMNVTFTVEAAGFPPLTYQWRRNTVALPGATNETLSLTNVQHAQAGDYSVVVADDIGSAATSDTAVLTVDTTFTQITTGSLVTESDAHIGASWGDFDQDGLIDLFITNLTNRNNKLFRNEGDGSFSMVTSGPIVGDIGPAVSGAWADYDNDGRLDLFVACGWDISKNNYLYRNLGAGAFQKITAGPIVNDGGQSAGCAWADYDRDGFLDLFVANGFGGQRSFLYRNNGSGGFTKVTTGNIVTDLGDCGGGSWGDYDNDGDPDLFVPSFPPYNDALHRNNGNGTFTKITTGPMVNEQGQGNGSAWGDYDNDGYLDLFVANAGGEHNYLYRNNRNGTFTKITAGRIVNDGGNSQGCAWGDYDNDGWLDLLVVNAAWDRSQRHFLYRNNGDGTFTKHTNSIVTEGGNAGAGAWGDYDNDGFLDLIVATGAQTPQWNLLYHNDGNSNHWITLRLVGAVSNRSAVGTKVRLTSRIGGQVLQQMRETSAGSGFYVQSDDLRAHFGLAEATVVDLVRIEWPSGIVQELRHVAANQFLTITEPPRLQTVGRQPDGSFQCQLTGVVGFRYALETSSNLTTWTPWTSVTNTSRTMPITDPSATNGSQRFYRAVSY